MIKQNTLETHYVKYISLIEESINFLRERFGPGNYIKMKNNGLIPARCYSVMNSSITGYAFHGNGCGVQFKNIEIDIEFENDVIGFTDWSFYLFVKQNFEEVSDDLISNFLTKKNVSKELKYSGVIYSL